MYNIVRQARYDSPSVSKPIINGGYFEEGSYKITTEVKVEDGQFKFIFKDVSGNFHKQTIKVDSYWWRGYRAAMLPDLTIQKEIDKLLETGYYSKVAEMFSGLKGTVSVGMSDGYVIKRSQGQYSAVNNITNIPYTGWKSLPKVLQECRKNNIYKSLHLINNIIGDHEYNIQRNGSKGK